MTRSVRLGLFAALCGVSVAAIGAPATHLPACDASDTRTPVPTWQPTVGDGARITVEPPQQAGQIVMIRIAYKPSPETACNDETLHPFALANTDGNPGGLSVNVKGHAREADGLCHFDGFYRNEEVPGMHQGWIETYFGAVPAEEVDAKRYCMAGAGSTRTLAGP